jgi:antitoxin (DNA-binding transcriptional repressor) of toxin-antitoxin stability system
MKTKRHKRPATVPATEAAKNFGRLIERVRETRATYVVERGGRPVVSIAPVEREAFTMRDFKSLFAEHSRASSDYLDAVERASKGRNQPRVRSNPWER